MNCTKALVGLPDIPLDMYKLSVPLDFITPAMSM